MKFIQNYHNEHTKFFGMLIVTVILYEFHTSHFAVQFFNFGFPFSVSISTVISCKNTVVRTRKTGVQ